MILTEEQKLAIQQKLNYAVTYKETYNEVYDHVITTLEINAGLSIDDVIKQDFNGYDNLKQMEKDRVKVLFKTLFNKHAHNMLSFFNWPTITFTTVITITGCYLALNPAHQVYLKLIVAALAVAPITLVLYRNLAKKFIAWRFDIYRKQSIKDNYIFMAAIISSSLLNIINLLNSKHVLYGVTTVFVFMFYTIYVLSYFKLYRDEYKIDLAV